MFNHKDTLQSSSFQAQVKGRKRWHLCSNAESKNLYKAGDVDTFSPNYEKYEAGGRAGAKGPC
jgi:ribosomal protein L16 Arg81 hydroxylase